MTPGMLLFLIETGHAEIIDRATYLLCACWMPPKYVKR